MRIFKYEIKLEVGPQFLLLPEKSKILDIQFQNIAGHPMAVLWAEINDQELKTSFNFVIVPTGSSVPSPSQYRYFRSIQDRALVYHFYVMLSDNLLIA